MGGQYDFEHIEKYAKPIHKKANRKQKLNNAIALH